VSTFDESAKLPWTQESQGECHHLKIERDVHGQGVLGGRGPWGRDGIRDWDSRELRIEIEVFCVHGSREGGWGHVL
jgi:hypothetical protein